MGGRLVWLLVIAAALYFAIEGGEYSTIDIVRLHGRIATLAARADSLQRAVDSLARVERLVRTDSVTQERIAREEFGLVRGPREILYRFIPDSAPPATHR